jgi:hypothetical protein
LNLLCKGEWRDGAKVGLIDGAALIAISEQGRQCPKQIIVRVDAELATADHETEQSSDVLATVVPDVEEAVFS